MKSSEAVPQWSDAIDPPRNAPWLALVLVVIPENQVAYSRSTIIAIESVVIAEQLSIIRLSSTIDSRLSEPGKLLFD